MEAPRMSVRTPNVNRRNLNFALAILFFALSCTFTFGLDGHMVWLMWRDATAVALVLLLAAVFFAVRWWRTPRS